MKSTPSNISDIFAQITAKPADTLKLLEKLHALEQWDAIADCLSTEPYQAGHSYLYYHLGQDEDKWIKKFINEAYVHRNEWASFDIAPAFIVSVFKTLSDESRVKALSFLSEIKHDRYLNLLEWHSAKQGKSKIVAKSVDAAMAERVSTIAAEGLDFQALLDHTNSFSFEQKRSFIRECMAADLLRKQCDCASRSSLCVYHVLYWIVGFCELSVPVTAEFTKEIVQAYGLSKNSFHADMPEGLSKKEKKQFFGMIKNYLP